MSDLHLDFVDYKKIFKNQETRLKIESKLGFIPTIPYLKAVYWIKTGKKLNLKNPKTFSEKENWLKVNNINYDYSCFVDKFLLKEYVSKNYGEQYIFKTLGLWEKFEDIDFDSLPNSFVLKCTHDSGSVKIIKDKSKINKNELEKFFNGRLKINTYFLAREYPYRYVVPKIMAEELHETTEGRIISDYKFFCFDGKPKVMYVMANRYQDEKQTWMDMNFNKLDIIDPTCPEADEKIKKPECFDKMVKFVTDISSQFKFVRVDLYEEDDRFYIGELTFFPYGGFVRLKPEKWEDKLGEWIDLD